MERIDLDRIPDELAQILERVASGEARMILCHDGKEIAALVHVEDAEFIQAREDRRDIEECEQRLADGKQTAIPWEKVKADLGLEP